MDRLQCNLLSKFEKDFKKLSKRYRTLPDDFAQFIDVISAEPPKPSNRIAIITQHESLWIIKARLACMSLRNHDLRIIFAYFTQERRVDFIELYFKGDKEREDRERIKKYLSERAAR